MTYSIAGRCERTGQLGVGITTWSLAAAGFCQSVRSNTGAVVSQAKANARLAPLGISILAQGFSAGKTVSDLVESDLYPAFRQIGVVDRNGDVGVHTGDRTVAWKGHVTGDGFAAFGNALEGPQVTEAMAEAFASSAGEELAERLIRALEAGRDAGGQASPYTERSAGIIVHELEPYPLLDLRIDADVEGTAVQQLRKAYEMYRTYIPLFYDLMPNHPDQLPTEAEWEDETTRSRLLDSLGSPRHRWNA